MTNKKVPMRQCVGCGEMKSKKELLRVIKTPEEEIVLDTTGRKNGRGAYICASMECVDTPALYYVVLGAISLAGVSVIIATTIGIRALVGKCKKVLD